MGALMNISNRINYFLFLIFACVSIAQVPAKAKAAEVPVTRQLNDSADSQMVDMLLQSTLEQLVRLDQITEHLARLLSDHQIASIKNPQKALHATTVIRTFLKEILGSEDAIKGAKNEVKLTAVFQLIRIGETLAQHYKRAYDAGLTQLTPFGIEEFKKISEPISINIDPQYLAIRLQKIEKLITKIEKRTEIIGLTWYNKLARKIDNYIVVPIERNNLGKAILLAGATALAGWYVLGEHGDNLQEIAPGWLGTVINKAQTTWGLPIRRDRDNRPITPQGDPIPDIYAPGYTWRSRMVDSVKNLHPLTWGALGMVGKYTYDMWDEIKERVGKHVSTAWNNLRGGAYEKSKPYGIWNFQPTHKFDKVIGLDEIKSEFSVLLEFLKNPETAIRRGLVPSKAYLLTGPPGAGKTYMVEGLCGEIQSITSKAMHQFKFFKIDAHMIHNYYGGIKGILADVSQSAPCVVFIDEIDLLGLQRAGDNKMLSDFLTSMGNSIDNDPMKLVIIIAATNKPEMLDKALLRNGRFKELRVEYPTFDARKKFLHKELSSYGLDIKQFNIDGIAQETNNHTIEDLRALIKRAIITSWIKKEQLNQTIIDYGLNKEIHHIMLEDQRNMPEHELKMLATYFAGRAFAHNLFDTQEELAKVTIKPVMTKLHERTAWQQFFHKDLKEQATIEHGGVFTKPKRIDSLSVHTKEDLLKLCKAYLAGTAAQEILLNNSCVYQDNADHNRAFMCAHRYVLDGLDPEKLSTDLQKQYQHKAHELFNACKEEVKNELAKHTHALNALAQELQKQAILTGAQVQAIIAKNKHTEHPVEISKKQKARRK